jgi:indolepyruvate ferredoxin oxidoreductase
VAASRSVSLADKYRLESGRAFMTGTQALVRLLIMQRRRDELAGLNTAGFVSGYRGSPLGGLDQELWRARKELEAARVHFNPGLNEELAATSVWGTQQVHMFQGARYDGVFALWYAKGPGVDRSGDVLRHANAAGTSPHGGVLAIAGDDHGAKSSSLPHQTDHDFKSVMMPVLAPAGVQEFLDLGLYGWALSRYSGCWVAMKAIADTVETSASVDVDPERVRIVLPADFDLPREGLNIRWPDPPLVQEERLLHHKLYAALAFCRANRLNPIVIDSPRPRLGILSAGKAYLDVRQALDDLGIDEALAAKIGLRVCKVGMVWPLEAESMRQFAEGLEEILVVEEKRQLLEYQLKEELYNWREDVRPRIVGKFDEKGEWALPHGGWLLPAAGELTPAMIARVIARRIARFYTSERIRERLAFLEAKERALAQPHEAVQRIPHYCSGCPHNRSTKVIQGSRALAGIGCHYMAAWLYPTTTTFCQMGGEGAVWIGQAPFTETPHIFANLGDGTFFHSGSLAIRAAVAANVPITYKILYNDAVAMTGGQPVDGTLSVGKISRLLADEGVGRIVVVTDQPDKYRSVTDLSPGVPVRHRDELESTQEELRDYKGVSALIYDQTCAAEKRRRRKRGTYPDLPRRVMINEAVCEGCGDCSDKSFCLSVTPVETEYGTKRQIDQSSCNKDYSCLDGFCPSFVTVEGGALRKGRALEISDTAFAALPEPELPSLDEPYGLIVTGVGGTGVVTIGALLGMAAHVEGRGITVLDMAGLAQKGGAVWSHVRIGRSQQRLYAARIAAGEANAVVGGDIVVAAGDETIAKMRAGFTRAVINSAQSVTSDTVRRFALQASSGDVEHYRDPQFPLNDMERRIAEATGEGATEFLDATRLATALMGDALATNVFLLGYAWQKGLVPLLRESIERAIELNGVAVEANLSTFLWGRRAAVDLARVEELAVPATRPDADRRLSHTLDEAISRRIQVLTDYQDAAYAHRYASLVERVRVAEARIPAGMGRLREAVAHGYFKLLAYKDEYEVARLYVKSDFLRTVNERFEGRYRLNFHLAPPIFARRDPKTGHLKKRAFGPWMLTAFRLLARLKGLRGTWFDPFGRTAERREERALIAEYEATLEEILNGLTPANHALAVEIASLPREIRGFGHVKARYIAHAKEHRERLLAAWRSAGPGPRRTRLEDIAVLAK